jgi:hypothetical protein
MKWCHLKSSGSSKNAFTKNKPLLFWHHIQAQGISYETPIAFVK